MIGRNRWLKIGEQMWISSGGVNEVHKIAPPESVAKDARWIDVDLGEQVLVAYQGTQPVFATLVSSGATYATPRGDYPIWAKAASISMKNPDYEDKSYYVGGVPWAMFFQGSNALHGAYWHNQFGHKHSHGCVNLAPRDARVLFHWVGPALPAGWNGIRPADLREAVLVHIRNSHLSHEWRQDRPIGPPNANDEKKKSLAAQERRKAQQASDAAAAPEAQQAAPLPGTQAPLPGNNQPKP